MPYFLITNMWTTCLNDLSACWYMIKRRERTCVRTTYWLTLMHMFKHNLTGNWLPCFNISWPTGLWLGVGVIFTLFNWVNIDFENGYTQPYPDNKFHGANIGPIWGRQDPGGPHVGPVNVAIWVTSICDCFKRTNWKFNEEYILIACQISGIHCFHI